MLPRLTGPRESRLLLPPQVIREFDGDERREGQVIPEAEAEGDEVAETPRSRFCSVLGYVSRV
jgi:hypothetical protein